MRKFLVALALLVLPSAAHAAEPLFSGNRLGLAANVGHVWYADPAGTEVVHPFSKEFEVGVRAAYNLVGGPEVAFPVSLTWSSDYALDSRVLRHRLGLSVVLKKAGD